MIDSAEELWKLLNDCITKLRASGREDVAGRLNDAMGTSNVPTEVFVETYSVLKEYREVLATCCGPSQAEEAMAFIKSVVTDFKWND